MANCCCSPPSDGGGGAGILVFVVLGILYGIYQLILAYWHIILIIILIGLGIYFLYKNHKKNE